MEKPKTPIEILKILNKSNCKECNEPTCLAFAAAVFNGRKQLRECPHLNGDTIAQFGGESQKRPTMDQDMKDTVEQMKARLAKIDLESEAGRLGAKYTQGKLTLKVCGKDFHVDSEGNFASEIHIHSWLTIPVLSYILDGAGAPMSGKWISLRELKDGKNWAGLFGQRCEKPLKKVADTYTDLFHDMLHIFNGRQVENHYESDISLVLYPLPLFPILICYWKPEDGLESSLNIFFDATAEKNLPMESIYALATGLVRMFEKIALRHGFGEM
jgi:hypothetical protein